MQLLKGGDAVLGQGPCIIQQYKIKLDTQFEIYFMTIVVEYSVVSLYLRKRRWIPNSMVSEPQNFRSHASHVTT